MKQLDRLELNNCSDLSVKHVNHTVDVKKDLCIQTRLSYGVRLRSGQHIPRSDVSDFNTLVNDLTELEIHLKKQGRN